MGQLHLRGILNRQYPIYFTNAITTGIYMAFQNRLRFYGIIVEKTIGRLQHRFITTRFRKGGTRILRQHCRDLYQALSSPGIMKIRLHKFCDCPVRFFFQLGLPVFAAFQFDRSTS